MGNQPLVSILGLTENRPAFMPWFLWNTRKQTYENTEVVLVGAESDRWLPSGCVEVLRTPDGTSIGAKRNLALRSAGGKYVVWFDDDDWQHPERVQRTVDYLEEHPNVGIAGWGKGAFVNLQEMNWNPYKGIKQPIHSISGFRTEEALRFSYIEKHCIGSDTRYMDIALRKCRHQLLDDPHLISFWLRHGRNWTHKDKKSKINLSLKELKTTIGVAAWGDTDRWLEITRRNIDRFTFPYIDAQSEKTSNIND